MNLRTFFRREILVVGALFAAAFLLYLVAVAGNAAHQFDSGLLLSLREGADGADPIGPAWVEHAITDISALGGYAVLTLVTLGAIGFLIGRGNYGRAALLIVAVGGGSALSELLKLGINRPRPDLVAHVVETTSMSFPSGHATLSAVTYLTLAVMLSRTQERRDRVYIISSAIVLVLLIGLSRIYLGVHWPTDVLGGWMIGAGWAFACWSAAAWIEQKRTPKT